MSALKSFASDNNSGAHPAIMEAMIKANEGFLKSYGDDEISIHTDEVFKEYFGSQASIHYVTTGTAANVLGLRTVTQTYNSVLCAAQAHINNDECGAPEAFGGIKLVPIPSEDGKLTPVPLPRISAMLDSSTPRSQRLFRSPSPQNWASSTH